MNHTHQEHVRSQNHLVWLTMKPIINEYKNDNLNHMAPNFDLRSSLNIIHIYRM